MRDAYNRRIDRWVTFRQHIAQRLKMHFLRNLNNRGCTCGVRAGAAESIIPTADKRGVCMGRSQSRVS